MLIGIYPVECAIFQREQATAVTFSEDNGVGVSLAFNGSLAPCAADLAVVFDTHHQAADKLPLLEAAMIAIDCTTQDSLAALIRAAQDMQSQLAEAAAE